MRGHGFASSGRSLLEVGAHVRSLCQRHARAQMRAKQLGGKIKYLSQGEIDARNRGYKRVFARNPGAPGNTGPPRPGAATCSASPTTGTRTGQKK